MNLKRADVISPLQHWITWKPGYDVSKIMLQATLSCVVVLITPSIGWSHDFLEDTRLSDMKMGSSFEAITRQAARGGYELEDGRFTSFKDWYSSGWRDVSVTFETRLDGDSWLLWGLSTGERGDKYRIQPSLILGYERVWTTGDNSFLTFDMTAKLGGRLKEETCAANYALSSGPVAVNCRLAASLLPPDQTLDYLWDESPADLFRASLGHVVHF